MLHDTEDKVWWFKHGEMLEKAFVDEICPKIGLSACINPYKSANPTAPDLIVNCELADLKVQTIPFFTAFKYNKKVNGKYIPFNPCYTVTFNKKDYDYYISAYPDINIYFWVDWQETVYTSHSGRKIEVDKLSGVWMSSFAELAWLINRYSFPLHEYYRRQGQVGNARDSYLIDIRYLTEVAILENQCVIPSKLDSTEMIDITTVDAWL